MWQFINEINTTSKVFKDSEKYKLSKNMMEIHFISASRAEGGVGTSSNLNRG